MSYLDKYCKFIDSLPKTVNKAKKLHKKVVFGYTSNLDILLKWDVNIFNAILKKYLKDRPSVKEGESIDSMEDFARILSYYLLEGLGGEVDISNIEVCNFLEKYFETEPALGGTAAQGCAALGAIGFPSIIHLTDSSREVCKFINYPDVSLISDNELVSAIEGVTDTNPIKHFILQYDKGDIIEINGKQYVIPVSNRLIMDYDNVHKYLPVQYEFTQYIEENAKDFYSYSISGFNLIVDINTLHSRLKELERHYSKLKQENPKCILYLEGAHYLNSECKHIVFEKLAQYIDILGMNEEELVAMTEKIGIRTNQNDLNSVLIGLDSIISKYPVKGIVLHTKDYAMYYGKRINEIDIEKGLTLGNLMAATKARTGVYGSREDCRESLSLELSPIGLAFAEELENLETKQYTCIVPSRYMKYPKSTIGLGDTFVAGVQIGFIN